MPGNPIWMAAFSAASLADAVNCVRQGHVDWWVPAAIAFGFALLVRAG